MKIAVTGGTGFIGRRFVEKAAAQGNQVRCLVRRAGDAPPQGASTVCVGDITDRASLAAFVDGADAVVHLAAAVGHSTAAHYEAVNVQGTINVCEAMRATNPQGLLLHCSSVAVLRRHWLTPLNTRYANSKARAEDAVWARARDAALRATVVYAGLAYGPGDKRFFPALLEAARAGRLVKIAGGERWAPLVYIDDLCDLMLHALGEPPGGRHVGVGPQDVGMHGVLEALAGAVGGELPRRTLPKAPLMAAACVLEGLQPLWPRKRNPLPRRAVDVLSIQLDPQIARRINGPGWEPKVAFPQGLAMALRALDIPRTA